MPATGTAMAPAPIPSAPVDHALLEQKVKLQARMRSGAGWFMAVALFSVINSALVFFDAKLHFIVGLGVTQIADGVGKVGGAAGSVAGFVVSVVAAGVFTIFWKFSREGKEWAFLTGMILYGFDGLIFLAVGAWLDLAFHAFALFSIYKGLTALYALKKLDAQSALPSAQSVIR